jgi:hypothetical protein
MKHTHIYLQVHIHTSRWLALGCQDGRVLLTELSMLEHHDATPSAIHDRDIEITDVTFSPNAMILAVACRDKVIDLYALRRAGLMELQVFRIGALRVFVCVMYVCMHVYMCVCTGSRNSCVSDE